MLPTSDWFSWSDRRGAAAEPPQAWASGWVRVHQDPALWDKLELRCDRQVLPLMLIQKQGKHLILAAWPALGAGYCRLQLWQGRTQIAQARVFVSARHLSPAQWLALLAELRYRLPARMLLKSRGGLVPLAAAALASDPEEERLLLQTLLSDGSSGMGLLEALNWLRRFAHKTPHSCGTWQSLYRSRRPSPAQLGRTGLSPTAPVWEALPTLSLDQAENRFVAGVVALLKQRMTQLGAYLEAAGRFEQADLIRGQHAELERAWRSHPLANLKPSLSLPANRHVLAQPAYICCVKLWQVLSRGFGPDQVGLIELPYDDLALLYQHWCLLQCADALLGWAGTTGWQILSGAMGLRRGDPYLRLQRGKEQITLTAEVSYGPRAGPHGLNSLSLTQRPDISLLITSIDRPARLLIFETKYRSEAGEPFKADLDKLHAYRDAIRQRDGQAAVVCAVLLYPGRSRCWAPAIEAWHALPGELAADGLPLAGLLSELTEASG